MKNLVKRNLTLVQDEIAPYQPNIIAVTKYFGPEAIIQGYDAGLRNFGESRVVEAAEKIASLPDEIRESSTFHLIGHLQTNKVKKAVENFDYIHSVDSLKLAEAISNSATQIGKRQKVLVQVNNANEPQKFGFSKEELFENFGLIRDMEGIVVCGLMAMAPIDANEEELSFLFSEVSELRGLLEERFDCKLQELSMGMSNDYKIAVACGATMIRLGRKLYSK